MKLKRQTLKGSILSFIVKMLIFSYCPNANNSIDDIKVRVEKLESIFREYENVQSHIDALKSSDNMVLEEDYRSDIEDKYFAIKAMLSARTRKEQLESTIIDIQNQTEQFLSVSSAINALIDHQNTLGTLVERLASPCNDPNAASTTSHASTSQQKVRLSRIQIPEFDGTYINWIHFHYLFEVMVHTKSSLANIEKFEYLLTKLIGEALSIVRHLKPADALLEQIAIERELDAITISEQYGRIAKGTWFEDET